ncbi:MAG: ABC transporter permease [Actinobacteria bacterium]|nr:ABC transporter permease [Actinomycetota bacterium]
MKALLRYALARVAARRARALLAAGGIAAAAAMLGAATTVAYSLATGFDRAADRAGLPHAIARFDSLSVEDVRRRALALPNVESASFRLEKQGVHVHSEGNFNDHGKVQGIRGGRRGYAIVAGRDIRARGEIVIERGLEREWGVELGDAMDLSEFRSSITLRVVGVAVTPDNVAFPLTNGPRLYARYDDVRELVGEAPGAVNVALLWVQEPDLLDVTLAQARAASFGIDELTFVTRDGIRSLINQAAGIVIALLVAFSLVAVGAAVMMLSAASAADVQRRLRSIGVLRTLGATPRTVAGGHALEAALVALPAGIVGILAGTLAVLGPTERLLEALSELGAGAALVPPLAGCLLALVGIVALAAGWPAWRAASRPPVETLGGADLVQISRRGIFGAGTLGLGLRLALSRPARAATTVAVLASAAAVVLLMLSLAGLLQRLETDPETVGKRYRLTVSAPVEAVPRIARLPGVAGATARYETVAADSFSLGETFELIGFAADHVEFEAPPLAEGRRITGEREVEVGLGLAQALNLSPGGTLAAQLASGEELRYRVSGVVRALENEGRVAYVGATRLARAQPFLTSTIAILIAPGATKESVAAELAAIGYFAEPVVGVTVQNGGFLDVLAALLRSLAGVVGLVCLYVLAQMLALTAQERRRTIAVLQTFGAGRRHVAAVLAGSALLVATLGAACGIVLERFVVGPAAASLAASYVSLPLVAGAADAALVTGGLVALAVLAAAWVGGSAARRPIVVGLRED